MSIQKSSRHSLAKTFFDRRPTSQIAVGDSVTLKIYSKSSNNHKLLHGYRWKLELCYFVGQTKVLDSVESPLERWNNRSNPPVVTDHMTLRVIRYSVQAFRYYTQ